MSATHFECLVCMPREDGENVVHPVLQSYRTNYVKGKRRHPHEAASNIIRDGLLERDWWMLSKSVRLAIVRRYAPANSWVLDLVEKDGPARSAAKRYLVTGGKAGVGG